MFAPIPTLSLPALKFEVDLFQINMNQYDTIQNNTIEQLMHDTVSQLNDCSRIMAVGVVLMNMSITSLALPDYSR